MTTADACAWITIRPSGDPLAGFSYNKARTQGIVAAVFIGLESAASLNNVRIILLTSNRDCEQSVPHGRSRMILNL
jgi:hypothetical protein